jgi:hypothetical protein
MSRAARLTGAVAVAAIFTGLSLSAMAQQPGNPNQPPPGKPAGQGQPVRPQGQPARPQGQPPGQRPPAGAGGQFRAPGQMPQAGYPPGAGGQTQMRAFGPAGAAGAGGQPGTGGLPRGPGQPAQFRGPGPGQGGQMHAVHAIGERGYSFHGGGYGRRDIATFDPRERAVWGGGRWHHERRFGRMGYWWEVNGAWYYYDQPLAGPPAYVSEMEFFDDDLDPDAPVMVGQPAPVMVEPPPVVYVRPPPVVCIGPLCVR